MNNYKKSEHSELLLPASYESDQLAEYGEGRRVSEPFNVRKPALYNRAHPQANGSWKVNRISASKLINRPLKEVIKTIAYSAASGSNALDLYKQYINAGHDWETESTRDERILEDMEDRVSQGVSLQTKINQFVYGMKVEGAFCGEVTGDRVQGIYDISPVSPLEVTFSQEIDPRLGVVDIVGQGFGANFRPLQDPRNPNPYFIYDPLISDATQPWGAIPWMAAVGLEIMHAELFTKTDQWLDGEVFPKGYFSFDLSMLQKAQLQPNTIQKWVQESVAELQKVKNSGDITQSPISKVPVLWTLVGSTGKTNIDGVNMLDVMIRRSISDAYKLPAFLEDSGESSGGFGRENRSDMLLWLRRIHNDQRVINSAFTQWGNLELEIHGSRNQCEFVLDSTDLEGDRITAEKNKLEAEVRKTQAEADAAYVNAGILSVEEVRRTLSETEERYADIDVEMIPVRPMLPAPANFEEITDYYIKQVDAGVLAPQEAEARLAQLLPASQ